MAQGDLSQAQWQVLEAVLPAVKQPGRRPRDRWQVINGTAGGSTPEHPGATCRNATGPGKPSTDAFTAPLAVALHPRSATTPTPSSDEIDQAAADMNAAASTRNPRDVLALTHTRDDRADLLNRIAETLRTPVEPRILSLLPHGLCAARISSE